MFHSRWCRCDWPHKSATILCIKCSFSLCVWYTLSSWGCITSFVGTVQVGQLISDAMARVGRQGVVTMEESRTAEDRLYVVEGMQFDRGYNSPYFVTDPERMVSHPDHDNSPASSWSEVWPACMAYIRQITELQLCSQSK